MASASRPGPGAFDLEALARALGGLEAREEQLELEPVLGIGRAPGAPRTAAVAGVDADGRAVLVLDATGDDAVLAALDALAWCDAHGDLLARRLGADEARAPCVVVVLAAPDPRVEAGLAALRPGDLRAFVARAVRGARGAAADLAEIALNGGDRRASPAEEAERALDEASRRLLARYADGVARIDPALRGGRAARARVWIDERGECARLRLDRGRLVAVAAGEEVDLRTEADVDRALEALLRGWLAGHDGRAAAVAAAPSARGGSGAAAGSDEGPPAGLMPRGPLLSADELATLRGDA
jgi:hypothetical protein